MTSVMGVSTRSHQWKVPLWDKAWVCGWRWWVDDVSGGRVVRGGRDESGFAGGVVWKPVDVA